MHHLIPSLILEKAMLGQSSGQFDAVVLFIDTSGFTRLTTQLTEQGREGAEVLADILQTVFEPLVEAVYAHGGFIAGFAGDAFKAIYPSSHTVPLENQNLESTEIAMGNAGFQRNPAIDEASYLHALATAEQIRSHMDANPSHETPYGTFDFRVRLSIGDGQVTWSIWASDDEDAEQTYGYTFSGSALDQAIRGEDHADGGELVVTQSVHRTISASQPDLLTGRVLTGDAEGYLCITNIAKSLPVARSVIGDVPAPLGNASSFYPEFLLTTQTRGEFRTVQTLFINVQRLPKPNAEDDFLPIFFQLLHQYGGYLCRIGRVGSGDPGGTFLLFWGAPISHENDLERVISFVLALREKISIPFRAGITYGVVYAGFVGSALREEYTCHGNSVNQAARQMGVAEWGQILLDAETARRAQDEFALTLAGHYALKGLEQEQPLFAVGGSRIQDEESIYRTNFIGRYTELTQLQSAIQPIFSGKFGGIVHVSGEAGIGKSRLVHEFLMMSMQEDLQIFIGQVDEILREPLNPLRYFLDRYFEQSLANEEDVNKARFDETLNNLIAHIPSNEQGKELQAELVRTRSFLGALVNVHWADSLYELSEPKLRYENTFAAIKALIKAESLRRPLLLLLEDGQWLDPSSLSFLEILIHNVESYPFAILITARPADEGVGSTLSSGIVQHELYREIFIEPLSETDIANLAQDYLGSPTSMELSQLLKERAEGNPFFAEQLLLYLQENSLLVDEGMGWELAEQATESGNDLPADLQTVLVARLDRLTQEVKQVVQTAAVLGREFSVQILSQMLRDEATLGDKMRAAEESAVWNSLNELRYLFRHALLRDAAYEMQLRARLNTLHRLAANAIETLYIGKLGSHYSDLVYHYRQSNESDNERTYARLAGEHAASQYANHAAITYYSRALELTPDDLRQLRFELLFAREHVYDLLGDTAAQKADLDQLLDLASAITDDAQATAAYQAQVTLRLTKYHEQVGDFSEAADFATEAIRLAQFGQSPESEATAYFRWCIVLSRLGYYEEAREKAESALSIAQAHGIRKLEAHSIMQLGNSDYFYDRYEDAAARYKQILVIYQELSDLRNEASTLTNLGLVARYQGDYQLASDYSNQAIQKHRAVGNRRGLAGILQSLGALSLEQYKFDDALSQLTQSLLIYRELGDRNGELITLTNLCNLYRTLGDYPTAEAHNQEALKLAIAIGKRQMECTIYMVQSFLDFLQHRYEIAHTQIQKGIALADQLGAEPLGLSGLKYLGHVLAALGQADEAQSAYQRGVEFYRAQEQPQLAIEMLAFLARITLNQNKIDEGTEYTEEILAYLETDEALYGVTEPMSVYLACIHLLKRNNDSRAETLVQTAYRLLMEWASNIDDEVLSESFLNGVASHREIIQVYRQNADS
ncbi:MAG: tetratricopeptide repeat protein [Chloroflexota bacterium]